MTDLEIELGRKALAHLLSMPSRSIDIFIDEDTGEEVFGGCRYRSQSGARCAIGAILPDEFYSEDFEGWPAFRVLSKLGSHLGVSFSKEFQTVCDKLQCLHDSEFNWAPEGFRPKAADPLTALREIREQLKLPLDNSAGI